MSRNRATLQRRAQALSTNNRGFVTGARFNTDIRENLNEEDDEDVRLEHYRRPQKIDNLKAIAGHSSRGLRNVEVIEESPNGYELSAKAPPELDRAVKYYSYYLRRFTVKAFPEEYAVCHYSLGKMFFAHRPTHTRDYEARAKAIENGLHHFRLAIEVFAIDSHPIMFGVCNIFIGQLFRERASLITGRSILAKRGVSVNDSCSIGLAQLQDAVGIFTQSPFHVTEAALCNLEIGWLYVLQMTEALAEDKSIIQSEDELMTFKEHAIVALERAQWLVRSLSEPDPKTKSGKKARKWDPMDINTHPAYIKLLLMGMDLNYIEGTASYLIGRCYQEFGEELEYQVMAFNNLNKAVKPGRLPMEVEQWADAHHRLAEMLIRYPAVYDEKIAADGITDSDITYLIAANHLGNALKCPAIKPGRRMDLAFHLAQANVARLHVILDRVPPGESISAALNAKDGLDIMKEAESGLRLAMKGATAANTQSTQDAFIYYYSNLKLSEFRVLQTGMAWGQKAMKARSKHTLILQAFNFIVDSLLARTIIDNLDLHYVATQQMSATLFSVKAYAESTAWYTKALMCLSAMANRVHFTPSGGVKEDSFKKVAIEMDKQIEKSINSSSRELKWDKSHLGPLYLTEAVVSGYAYWSFEISAEEHQAIQDRKEALAAAKLVPLTAAEAKASRRPPDLLPPHIDKSELENVNRKRLLGATQGGDKMLQRLGVVQQADGSTGPAPPAGSVPLWAMDHHPEFGTLDQMVSSNNYGHTHFQGDGTHQNSEGEFDINEETQHFFANRQRRLVPAEVLTSLYRSVNITKSEATRKNTISLMPMSVLGAKNSKKKKDLLKSTESRTKRMQKTHLAVNIGSGELSHTQPKKQKKGFFSSLGAMFGLGKPDLEEQEKQRERRTRSAKYGVREIDEATKSTIPEVDLFVSKQAFCLFMTLSRLSRTKLVLTCNNLKVNYGERTKEIFANLLSDMGKRFYDLNKKLYKVSKRLKVPPVSLRELSHRSFNELSHIFRANIDIVSLLADYEEFLFTELVHFNYYVPMFCSMQALSRDINGYDRVFMDSELLKEKLVKIHKEEKAEDDETGGEAKRQAEEELAEKLTKSYKQQEKEDRKKADEEALIYSLFQKMDGSGFFGGSKHMLAQYLDEDECLLCWHYPTMNEQKLHLVLIWRQETRNKDKLQKRREKVSDIKKGMARNDPDLDLDDLDPYLDPGRVHMRDIVMEVCKSEVNMLQVDKLISNYMKALAQKSATKRTSHATRALRSLSAYLSLGEILLLVPKFIKNLIICCPSNMRMIPWHLLLVEFHEPQAFQTTKPGETTDSGHDPLSPQGVKAHEERGLNKTGSVKDLVAKGKLAKKVKTFEEYGEPNLIEKDVRQSHMDGVIERHLVEKFGVRMGPTLSLYEICEKQAGDLPAEHGIYRMCCVDGESILNKSPGLRATEKEVQLGSAIFSSDPDDITLLQGETACPRFVTTSKLLHVSRAERLRKKKIKEMKEKMKRTVDSDDEDDDDLKGLLEDSDISSDDEEVIANRDKLRMCRVLHVAANRMTMMAEMNTIDGDSRANTNNVSQADMMLGSGLGVDSPGKKGRRPKGPQVDRYGLPLNHTNYAMLNLPQHTNSEGEYTSDLRKGLSSGDLVAQVTLANCALCVLSRHGITDGSLNKTVMEANVELIDAAHLAGACTVMYPCYNAGNMGGLSTLANLLFFLKFYMELPIHSRERHSVCIAVRESQLWLKDQTAKDIIAWLGKAPIGVELRDELTTEMESYAAAAEMEKTEVDETTGDIIVHEHTNKERSVDKKFFSHFLQWGNFVVSGQGGCVHPRALTEENENVTEDHLIFDSDLDNIQMEIMMLKEEKRYEEAAHLERRARQLRIDAIKKRASDIKKAGILASRAFADAMDALDKALLDQDEDEIDIDAIEAQQKRERDIEMQKRALLKSKKNEKAKALKRMINQSRGKKAESGAGALTGHTATSIEERTPTKRRLQVPEYFDGMNELVTGLADTPTPISRLTSYIENLFPDGDPDLDENRVKPKRLIGKTAKRGSVSFSPSANKRDPPSFNGPLEEREELDLPPVMDQEEEERQVAEQIYEKERAETIRYSRDNSIYALDANRNSGVCSIS